MNGQIHFQQSIERVFFRNLSGPIICSSNSDIKRFMRIGKPLWSLIVEFR